jgi:hypothetical protein
VAKYREVRVQLIRDAAGNPSHCPILFTA